MFRISHELAYRSGRKYVIFAVMFLFPIASKAATINIVDDIHTYTSLSGDTVNMSSVSELHVTSATTPISGCTINLNSVDSFFFLENIKPSVAASTYLSQVKVSGTNAVLGINVRVVEYAVGAVIIPQSSTFQPLQVFTGENFQGNSAYLSQYTAYNTSSLGAMASSISSFILKRGYTATFAQTEFGTGYSKNYVAQDCDLEIGVLPTKLNNQINFVRIFPWRWTGKKGIADNIGSNLNIKWWYNWNINQNSTPDKEYVPIRQVRWWPSLGQDWQARGASHLLGYNEPDSTRQANITVGDAIWSWPDLLGTGLRVGSPATTDGGWSSWLYPFMDQADADDLRVDFVAVHYYKCWNPADPSGAATQMYNYLKGIHDRTGRPVWVTEWNNGANWTGCGDPTFEQQRDCISAMIDMLDSTPWVERYAIYNWVEDVRRVEWDDGSLTDAGFVYRDQVSPIGYRQEIPGSGKSANAIYSFDTNFRDSSGNGNNPLFYGAPRRVAGRIGNAIALDGADDYLVLPTNMGQSTDFTFAAWVFWNGGGQWQRIFDFGNDTTKYLFLTPGSYSNTLRFAVTTSGSGNEQRVETTGLAVGKWVHVVVTLSGNIGTLYVNGSPEATNTSMTINPSDFDPTNNYIGKSQFLADPLFSGMIDEVYVVDNALSESQIAGLMNKTADLNYDGRIDNKDYCILANDFSEKESPADIAPQPLGDGKVDFKDLALFVEYWLTATTIPPLPAQAGSPYPSNHATGIAPDANLSWTAGASAISHDVYIGTSNPPPFISNVSTTTFVPGWMPYQTNIYWRIDEINGWGRITGKVWEFTTMMSPPPFPGQATNPNPADGATGVSINQDLSWTPGSGVISHDVYFGTSMILPFIKNQTAATFEPGRMEPGTKYYWRINENTASGSFAGPLWSFTTTTTPPPPPPP